jgi:hypothetical protein
MREYSSDAGALHAAACRDTRVGWLLAMVYIVRVAARRLDRHRQKVPSTLSPRPPLPVNGSSGVAVVLTAPAPARPLAASSSPIGPPPAGFAVVPTQGGCPARGSRWGRVPGVVVAGALWGVQCREFNGDFPWRGERGLGGHCGLALPPGPPRARAGVGCHGGAEDVPGWRTSLITPRGCGHSGSAVVCLVTHDPAPCPSGLAAASP